MKKTKVILFILLFALVIGVSTQVKAGKFMEEAGRVCYYGTYSEFIELSEQDRNRINFLYMTDKIENVTISFNDMHLEDMKSLTNVYFCSSYKIKDEEYDEMANIKDVSMNDFENIEDAIKGMKNLEDIQINNYNSDIDYDYSFLKNFKNLRTLSIYNKKMTDIGKLPELENLKTLVIDFGCKEETELKNIKEIKNKFKKLDVLQIPNIEISYDELMEACESSERYNRLNYIESLKMIVIKECKNDINKGDKVKFNIPHAVRNYSRENEIETNKCVFYEEDYFKLDYIILDTGDVGENEASLKYYRIPNNKEEYIEFIFKYTVVEPELPEEPEEPTEPQELTEPELPEEPTEPQEPAESDQPTTQTGRFISKILETIRNLIKSVLNKITSMFKFKL